MKKLLWLGQVLWVFVIAQPWQLAIATASEKLNAALLRTFFVGLAAFAPLGLTIFVVAGALIGVNEHLFPAKAWQYVATNHSYINRHTGPRNQPQVLLASGHRCANPQVYVLYPESATCVDTSGSSIVLQSKRNFMIVCCTKVIEGSDHEYLSGVRRLNARAQSSRLGHVPSYMMTYGVVTGFAVLTFAIAIISLRLLLWTPMRMLGAFIASARRGMANVSRVLRAPILTRANFEGHAPGALVACQLSDLHLVAFDSTPIEHQMDPDSWLELRWGALSGALLLQRAVRALLAAKLLSPSVVVVTGDLTDRGSQAEWDVWRTAVMQTRPWLDAPKLFALPGNHDLTFNPPDDPDPRCSRYIGRMVAFANANHKPDRDLELLDCTGLHERNSELLKPFPRLHFIEVDHPSVERVGMVLLNSNEYRSQHAISGALGELGATQLCELADLLTHCDGPILVAMHHHVGPITDEGLDRAETLQDRWMIALDGDALLDVLGSYCALDSRNAVLVLHGHRHRFSMATDASGHIKILGLPSSTLGMHMHFDGRSVIDGVQRIAAVSLTHELQWQVKIVLVNSP